jgi:N-acetylglucosamine-6-phosphate deacetylase
MSAVAILAERTFDGERMREGAVVVIGDGRIRDVVNRDALARDIQVQRLLGTLAPGFIDVQVNGGGGVLFNDLPTTEGIRAIGDAHRRFGTTGFLPTLVTDTREKMAAAVAAVRDGFGAGIPGLLGVHIEGPFLNPARKGVHDPQLMRPIEEEDLRIMTSPGTGRTLVTLAPEMVPLTTVKRLVEAGVIVSAGHTAATSDILDEARRKGLRGYTHLFNAMPSLAGREPGPVGAALSENETWLSLIADLHHVSAPSLRVALSAKSPDKVMLITDAMPTVGTELHQFALQGRTVFRRDGRLTTADGTLAGSDLDMATAVRNTHFKLGVDLAIALRMASLVPAEFLRLGNELGRIEAGHRANLVLLDDELRVRSTWIDGIEQSVVDP